MSISFCELKPVIKLTIISHRIKFKGGLSLNKPVLKPLYFNSNDTQLHYYLTHHLQARHPQPRSIQHWAIAKED